MRGEGEYDFGVRIDGGSGGGTCRFGRAGESGSPELRWLHGGGSTGVLEWDGKGGVETVELQVAGVTEREYGDGEERDSVRYE